MIPRKLGNSGARKRLIDNPNIQTQFAAPLQETPVTFDPIGYYTDSTDLQEIHKFALKCLSGSPPKDLEKQLSIIQNRLTSQTMIMIERHSLQKQAEAISKTLSENSKIQLQKLDEYRSRVSGILEDWSKRIETGPIQLGTDRGFDPEKLCLIRSYLQIATEFGIPINMSAVPITSGKFCPDCRKPFLEEDDQLICTGCNTYKDDIRTDVSFSDIPRVNNGNANNYTEEETFDWAMMCFQGKQPVNIPPIVWEKVDAYCKMKDIQKKVLRPVDMIAIFKEIGYSDYENANLFLSMYNGWTLPNISPYEDLLRQINRQFMQAYEEVKVDRDSAPNAFYRLYIYIQKEKIQVDTSGLKIPFLRGTKIDLDSNARRAYDYLGWTFEDTT
jgi:hypothetical protein